ncbi:MAG: hypothetical protein RI975_933 [Pseudomonadota bacterium]
MATLAPHLRDQIPAMQPKSIPVRLRERPYWAFWAGDKRPLDAQGRLLSVNEPETWFNFREASERVLKGDPKLWGIGTLLNGDGLVCIDLDHCIENGTIDPKALDILNRMNCGYIEISPSGKGLHAFGYSERLKSFNRIVDGVSVEYYAKSRFMTVTGHIVRDEGLKQIDVSLLDETEDTDDTEDTEVIEEIESHILSSRYSWQELKFGPNCFATRYGTRNRALFQCARVLVGVDSRMSKSQRKEFLVWWLEVNKAKIRTTDWEENWVDFGHAWCSVKYPHGEQWAKAIKLADSLPLQSEIEGDKAKRTYRICVALSQLNADGEFFVSLDQLSLEIGVDRSYAGKLIAALQRDGWISMIKTHTPKNARRFRLVKGTVTRD